MILLIIDYLKGYSYQVFGTVAADPGGVRSGENLEAAFDHLIAQMKNYRKVTIEQTQIQ